MLLLAASLFFTAPAPLEMPRAEAYLVSADGKKYLEDRFWKIDLWTSQTVVGRWLDDDGRVFTLSRLEVQPPAVSHDSTLTRVAYAEESVVFDKKKLRKGTQTIAFRDALSRLSPIEPTLKGEPPRHLPRGYEEVDYWHGTNKNVIVCTFLPEGKSVWRLAVWELLPGDDFDESLKLFEDEFLREDYLKFASLGHDNEPSRKERKKKEKLREHPERKALRSDARHSVNAYDTWRSTDSEEFIILDNIPDGGSFVRSLTNELPILRRKYAKALPSPIDGSNVLSVARVFSSRSEYLDLLSLDGLTNMMWTAAYWSPSRREIVAYLPNGESESLLRTFRHEAFHQYISYAMAMIPVSPWLNEGYAQYFEDEESLDWELPLVPSEEELKRLSALLPRLFELDYRSFYDGTDEERRLKYRLAWSVAVFIEKGMREIRHDPFKNFKSQYVAALIETRDMLRATSAAFGNKDRVELFVREWQKFWCEQ